MSKIKRKSSSRISPWNGIILKLWCTQNDVHCQRCHQGFDKIAGSAYTLSSVYPWSGTMSRATQLISWYRGWYYEIELHVRRWNDIVPERAYSAYRLHNVDDLSARVASCWQNVHYIAQYVPTFSMDPLAHPRQNSAPALISVTDPLVNTWYGNVSELYKWIK